MTFSIGQAILHASSASVMAFGFLNLNSLHISRTIETQYGGHFQFLTIQGLAIAWICMVIGLLSNLYPQSAFRNLKRGLCIIALPLSVVISVIYWTLISFSPTLIIQQSPNPPSTTLDITLFRIPLHLDLSLHAAPALALLGDFLLFERKYSNGSLRVLAPISILVFTLWYSTWVEYCAKLNNDIFPYPFLTNNPFSTRIVIYAGASLLAYTSLLTINTFHPRP